MRRAATSRARPEPVLPESAPAIPASGTAALGGILGFGDNIVDRFVDRKIEYPGGNCVNVAVHAARLGERAGYLGVIGDDGLGSFITAALAQEKVETARVQVKAGESGWTNICSVNGERTFLDWNLGGVTLSEPCVLSEQDLAYASGFDVVHSSVYSGTEGQLAKLAPLEVLRSYDFSSEESYQAPAYLARVTSNLDVALLSAEEDTEQTREALRAVSGPTGVLAVATLGADGALAYNGREFCRVPAAPLPGELVDTMGCGDAFFSALLVELLATLRSRRVPRGARREAVRELGQEELRHALDAGARYAAWQCLREGAFGRGRIIC